MADIKCLCHFIILLLTFCFMAVQCSLEPTDQFIDNPTDAKTDALTMHKRPSFFVGSRYGRSGGVASSSSSGGGAYAPSKTRRLNVVPRNDRFFLGSRYGKRAGTQMAKQPLASLLSTPYEQALFSEYSTGTQLSNKPSASSMMMMNDNYNYNGNNNGNGNISPNTYMSCIYTGLQNFYRCNSIDDNMFYVKNTAKTYAGYNDDAYDGDNDNDNAGDDDDDGDADDAVNVNDKDFNEVLSTVGATGAGDGRMGSAGLAALVNEADLRNEADVKN